MCAGLANQTYFHLGLAQFLRPQRGKGCQSVNNNIVIVNWLIRALLYQLFFFVLDEHNFGIN